MLLRSVTTTPPNSPAVRNNLAANQPAPPPLSEDEKRELETWEKRYQSELGLLQTPPTGPVSGDLLQARQYVQDLVQKLAGEDLKKQGVQLRVELFSGTVPQAAVDDVDQQEQDWEEKHPGQPWPIRTWLEAPKEGKKPLYRLVLTEGLLRNLQTREELGFVLAHELTRLLDHDRKDPENESNLKCSSQSWLDSRQMQAGVDEGALSMMTRAQLNPEGALSALNRLYAGFPLKYPKDDQKTALAAAAQVQEHEGLRIAILQAEVEKLRRSGNPATLEASQPLPALVPNGPGLYETHVPDFPLFQKAFNDVATQLAGDQTPAWMFGGQSAPGEVVALRHMKACPEDYEKALTGVCHKLAESSASPQQRVNGLLRTVLALKGKCLPSGFSESTQETIRQFLAANQGWQAQPFLDSLSRDGQSLHRDLVKQVQLNETFQNIVAPLLPKNGGLGQLAGSAAASYARLPETGAVDIEALPEFLKLNNQETRSGFPLTGLHNAGALDFLKTQKPAELAQQQHECGLPLGLVVCNELRALDQAPEEFTLQLRAAMAPIQDAANGVREDNARIRLRPPLADSTRLNSYLKEFFDSEHGAPFSAKFEAELPKLLWDVVRTCNHQPDLVFDGGRPGALVDGEERRLCQMLAQAEPQDKQEIVRFVSRQWSHELRVPTHSPRREWTRELTSHLQSLSNDELVKQLTTPDGAQHAQLLRKTLTEGYRLNEADLPDVSTASLAALDKRREAGEFEPKRENYPNQAEYDKADQDYRDRCEDMKQASRFLVPAESRLILSKLAILGHDPETSVAVASRMSPAQFVDVLRSTEETVERAKLMRRVSNDTALEVVGTDAGAFLMDGFLAIEKQIPELDKFYDLAQRTANICPPAVESRANTRGRFADSLFPRLDQLPTPELREWLGKDHILKSLKPEQTCDLLLKCLGDKVKEGADIEALGQAVADLDKGLKLQEKFPLAYVLMRDEVCEKCKLQPSNLNQVFPADERSPIQQVSIFQGQASGLSGLLAMTRNHTPQEQLETIEYLMGRTEDMPAFLEQASENQSLGPVAQAVRNARQDLAGAEPMVRVMVANSFLAGPTGLMRAPGGKEALLKQILSGVKPQFLKLAGKMTSAILASQGDTDSLAVAFVLGQKVSHDKNGRAKLTEADVLNRVFDSYGVPGIKMKQYLAFTSEFEHFREAFESSQDAAMPLNYFQMIKLIQKRFGDDWPKDLKVDKILGSGSVNVAIRYFNEKTQKREVVSLGREDIIEATRYDFERFNRFADALTADPADEETFGYIKGLTKIIQDSVTLEFDKESARAVQHFAYETYKHKYKGWTVRSIDAFQVQHLGLFMEEAKGKTARKILDKNPKLYQESMQPMAKAEFGLLKGVDSSNNVKPKPTFANPDFHDGQVLVDEANKTVTILDFGQAVPIDNKQRELALDLLTVLGKLDTRGQAAKRLNKRFFPNAGESLQPGQGITKEDLKPIWARKKKMDMFVHLLSLLAQKGADVPLSTIHWVLALNRQVVLGDKINQGVKAQVAGMVVNHKLGLSLGVYNTIYHVNEKVKGWAAGLAHSLGAWALGEPKPEPKAAPKVEPPADPHGLKVMDAVDFAHLADLLEEKESDDGPEVEGPRAEDVLFKNKKSSFGFYPEEMFIPDKKS